MRKRAEFRKQYVKRAGGVCNLGDRSNINQGNEFAGEPVPSAESSLGCRLVRSASNSDTPGCTGVFIKPGAAVRLFIYAPCDVRRDVKPKRRRNWSQLQPCIRSNENRWRLRLRSVHADRQYAKSKEEHASFH